MLRNHLAIAARHLVRNKLVTTINVLGLSLSLTAFTFICWYIQFELSFDTFHANADAIYRIEQQRYSNGEQVDTSVKTFPGIRSLVRQHVPEANALTGFYKIPANTGFLFRYKEKLYSESGGWLSADAGFFSVFNSLLIHGDPSTVLQKPNSIVVAESLAVKLFGTSDAVGQRIDRIDDHENETGSGFLITGVFRDLPANAHFRATIVEQINDSWPENEKDLWAQRGLCTYVRLNEDTDPLVVEEKLNTALSKLEHEHETIIDSRVHVRRLRDIHLHSNAKDELGINGNYSLLYLLGVVAMVVLVMAWINYINLQASRFMKSLKEYGIRRLIGSKRIHLATQFLVEYCCILGLAVFVSGGLVLYSLPYFEGLIGITLRVESVNNAPFWFIVILTMLGGSVAAGMYPALALMKFNPLSSIRGRIHNSASGNRLKQSFVVFQFSTSLVLIGFVLVVGKQMDLMSSVNKGVDTEQVISVQNIMAYSNQELPDKFREFQELKSRALTSPAIKAVASSSAIPGTEIGFSYVDQIKRNQGDPYDPTVYKTIFVSNQFIPVYGLELAAGNNFDVPDEYKGSNPWETSNWSSVILNEKAVHQLGFNSADEAVGAQIYFTAFDDPIQCRIIGVVKDYHHEAVKKEPFPTILFHNYESFQQVYFSFRLNAEASPRNTLHEIKKTWSDVFPDRPFEYFFIDEYYDQQYKAELRFHSIFNLFAGMAVFVAALGIFGITLYEANARIKEISIRKVLGASVTTIVLLLSRKNMMTILLSIIVSAPIGWLLSDEWLSQYPMRIAYSMYFVLVPFVVLLVVVATISGSLVFKAAATNPVDHLKNE